MILRPYAAWVRNTRYDCGSKEGYVQATMELALRDAGLASTVRGVLGVASLGATGGLTIPSAYVLDPGDLALSLGRRGR